MNLFKRNKIEMLFKKAVEEYKKCRYELAIKRYEEILELDDTLPDIYAGISVCYFELKKIPEAIHFIDIAIDLSPEGDVNFIYNKMLYLIHSEEDLKEEAVHYSKQLCELEPGNIEYIAIHANILFELKLYPEALRYYEKYHHLSDDKSQSYLLLSYCYSKMNRVRDSIKMLELSLIENPRNAMALNNMGYSRLKIKEYEKAIIDFEQAIKIKPDFAFPYNNKGFALLQLGKTTEALEFIEESIKLDSENSYAYKNLALYYLEINEKKSAIAALEIARTFGFKELYGDEVDGLLKKLKAEDEDADQA